MDIGNASWYGIFISSILKPRGLNSLINKVFMIFQLSNIKKRDKMSKEDTKGVLTEELSTNARPDADAENIQVVVNQTTPSKVWQIIFYSDLL